ncbi:MAG: efflux RND transporter periplasmic adaptor subunit [Deltaproteobacteria bacterium]|nr:efflux RND transporter periplasmic adaptor subunit [Deltaproteobacteria bacterium]
MNARGWWRHAGLAPVVLAGGLGAGLVACESGEPLRIEEPSSDEGTRAATNPADPAIDGPMLGVLVPEAEVVLVASGFARLERLEVQVGDHVREQQVVAEMDVRGDRTELAAAKAAWKASKAELERLGLELEQAKASRSDVEQLEEFISRAELREERYAEKLAAARKRSANASVRQQQSRMDEAEARIAEAELRAPFGGVIARRYVDAGATLSTGEPVVQLISDERLVRFAAPEQRAGALSIGGEITVQFGAHEASVTGTIVTIAPEIDAGTRLVIAEARLTLDDAQRQALRVGEVGRVQLVSGPR